MNKRISLLTMFLLISISHLGVAAPVKNPSIRIRVSQSAMIDETYHQHLKEYLNFYIKEYTRARVGVTNPYHYQLSVDFRREKDQYIIVTNLYNGDQVIEQRSQSVSQFLEIFAYSQELFDPLFKKAGLLIESQPLPTLDIAIGMGADINFKKELDYLSFYSFQIFNKLFLNTQGYRSNYSLFLFKSYAMTQNNRGMEDFVSLRSIIENSVYSPVKASLIEFSYDLDLIVNHFVNEHDWKSKNRLAIIFVSAPLNPKRMEPLRKILELGRKKRIQFEFVFLETLNENQVRAYQPLLKSLGMGFRSLSYKNIYLLENGNIQSFIFSQGSLYEETLGDNRTRKLQQISSGGVLKGVDDMKDYLTNQGYFIKKVLYQDISLPQAFSDVSAKFSNNLYKNPKLHAFRVGTNTILVANLSKKDLKKLRVNRTYTIKGKPIFHKEQIYLSQGSFKIIRNTPPSFLLTDADRILSNPFRYFTKGEGDTLEWFYKATYLGTTSNKIGVR